MAAPDTAALVASLTLNDKGFSRGIDSAIRKSGQLEKTLANVGNRAGRGLSTAAGNLAKIGTIATAGAVGLIAASVKEASDLNEQISKSSVVFGKASEEVLAFSKTTATSLGLAQSEALEAAGAFGNMFKTTGIAEAAAADMSTTMVTLAADMASFNNEDPSEMLDRLRSGLSGEAEPLRRFGVLLSEAAVKEEAYATGIAKTGDKLTEAQKVQARYSLILKQTAVQQGDFTRTSGSLANQQRILSAQLRQAGATIGTALLPAITKLATKLNTFITENQPAIAKFAEQLPAAFDKALAFAEKLPWDAIASGLQSAAQWAGVLVDAFLRLPPDVQATIIALAGLNKLSGGAISGIVSELGKGLIKGVLGMTAGVVNIKAATVTGAGGGVPGAAGGKGGGGGLLGAIGAITIAGFTLAAANEIGNAIVNATGGPTGGAGREIAPGIIIGQSQAAAAHGVQPVKDKDVQAEIEKSARESAVRNNASNERLEAIKAEQARTGLKIAEKIAPVRSEMIRVREEYVRSAGAISSKIQSTNSELQLARISAAQNASSQKATTAAGLADVRGAIQRQKLSVVNNNTVNVSTSVSVRETIKTQTTYKSYQRFQS